MKACNALFLLGPMTLAVCGCASVVSSRKAQPGDEGVAYMLPRALLPVEVTARDGALALAVKEPVLIGDPTERYMLRRSGNAFSSDNVQVTVNTATGLLEAVKVESTDQTIPTLIKLASARRAEGADVATTETLVFRMLLDPECDTKRLNDELNRSVQAYVQTLSAAHACQENPKDAKCVGAQALKDSIAGGRLSVEVEGRPKNASAACSPTGVVESAAQPKDGTPASTAGHADGDEKKAATGDRPPPSTRVDCASGLCYRVRVPYRLTLKGPGGVSNSALVALPNGSPTFVLSMDRWPFVKTSHDVKLQAGVLQSVTTDRPSSALALAAAPLDASKAVLGAVGEVLQLKIDLSGKEKALADAKVAEIQAKAALDAELVKKGSKAESGLMGEVSDRADIVRILVGTPESKDAKGNLRVSGGSASEAAEAPQESVASPPKGGKVSSGSAGTQK